MIEDPAYNSSDCDYSLPNKSAFPRNIMLPCQGCCVAKLGSVFPHLQYLCING